jgi:hypothetical protein
VSPRPQAAFYCVAGRDFFVGAVALLNSLRLLGHREPFFVLDHGMDARQRDLLEPHAAVVEAPSEAPPSLLKLVAPQAHPAQVMVLVDADVIVTRPLTELIEAAAGGRLVGFDNDTHRFFGEWAELLDLGTLEPGPYLTTSTLFVPDGVARTLLPLVEDRQMRVDLAVTWMGRGQQADPLFFGDQDVLNAVARSRLGDDEVLALETRLSALPPFAGLGLDDAATLRCRYRDGVEPYALHHYARKPWLVRMRSSVYSRLLTRLLLAPDVPLRLDPGDLPLRLRTGATAAAARLAVDVFVGAPAYARRRLRRRRIEAWVDRAATGEGSR